MDTADKLLKSIERVRTRFGVRISGVSGTEIGWTPKRSTADRVRRVLREWKKRGGWTGQQTLGELTLLAGKMKRSNAAQVIAEFNRRKPRDE